MNIRLKLHVWCIDLSIHLRRFTPGARGLASDPKAPVVEVRINHCTIAFGERVRSRANLLLWAREAGPRTNSPTPAGQNPSGISSPSHANPAAVHQSSDGPPVTAIDVV